MNTSDKRGYFEFLIKGLNLVLKMHSSKTKEQLERAIVMVAQAKVFMESKGLDSEFLEFLKSDNYGYEDGEK